MNPPRIPWLACSSVIGATLLLLVWVGVQDAVPAEHLLREPQTLAGQRWYIGALSTLGALIWCSASVLLFFAGSRLPSRARAVYLAAGALTALLASDDVFLLHDQVLPAAGLDDKVAYGAYGLCTAAFLFGFRRPLRASAWPLLVFALGFLGLSALLDAGFNTLSQLYEDGAKLVGIVCWAAWAWVSASAALTARDDARSPAVGASQLRTPAASSQSQGAAAVL